VAEPASWHVSSHTDSVSHVCVASSSEQGWPSGMTVGHVPFGPFPVGLQEPTRHRMVGPHGAPPLAQVTLPHTWATESQTSPVPQSEPDRHGIPAPVRVWHVEGSPCGGMGHTSEPPQSLDAPHEEPIPPSAAHVWVA
jgi:hypothetical protein